ncbi:MAG TPA: hypothetical protein VGJ44_17190 [Kribbellaceae bacterium]|jgi:hypothetical protein
MTVRRAVLGLVAVAALIPVAGCTDDPPAQANGTPSASSSTPAAAATTLPPMTKPATPWPTPTVTGAPADDAPLADRIRFAIAKQAQLAAGQAAPTTVSCPGLDDLGSGDGERAFTCTVTYARTSYDGKLTVDASRYTAKYHFTSDSVPVVRAKVVDAVVRAATDPAAVTCTMDDMAVVQYADPKGIACSVTTTSGAAESWTVRVSGDGRVTAVRM